MQLKENLKLIEIKINDRNTAVELYFFDETEKKIYSVNMSTQKGKNCFLVFKII